MEPVGSVYPILRDEPESPSPGIWGVRNYHSVLERRAHVGAKLTGGYLAMTVASATMATAGLLLDSSAAVIGSMCVAPFMAPSRAVCIGALFRQWRVFAGGVSKQLLGLLVVGTTIAILITTLLEQTVGGMGVTQEILIRAMPTTQALVLSAIIAIAAGAAASLALVAQPQVVETPWGQVIDAIIGVQIAISLIPPACVVGIGLALGMPEHSANALMLLLLNVICLDVLGSMAILGIRGVRGAHLDLEKNIRKAVAVTLDVVEGFISIGSTVDITLMSEEEAQVYVVCRRRFGGRVPETLASQISADVLEQTGCRVHVQVEVLPLLVHDGTAGR